MPQKMCGIFFVVMNQNNFDQFKNLFFKTAREHLDVMLGHLQSFEKNPTDQNLTDFRLHAHSLKGECLAMGFHDLGNIAKVIERITRTMIEKKTLMPLSVVFEMKQTVLKMKNSLAILQNENGIVQFHEEELRLQELSGISVIE